MLQPPRVTRKRRDMGLRNSSWRGGHKGDSSYLRDARAIGVALVREKTTQRSEKETAPPS